MESLTIYLLLLAAIALGYFLGRRERGKPASKSEQDAMQSYYRGLDFVLREPSGLAVERFLESMPVEEGTIDTHLALGAVLRHRGEADKAVRIHQNLIAQAQLSDEARVHAEFELARDYFSAGLLGRAENLLTRLAKEGRSWRQQAEQLLLDIYQREKDWTKAIAVGARLAKQNPEVKRQLAQFCCERAEQELAQGRPREAKASISEGMGYDAQCGRLYLIAARLEDFASRPKGVRKQVLKALSIDASLAVDAAALFERACAALNDDKSLERFLRRGLDYDASGALLQRLAELVQANGGDALALLEEQAAAHHNLAATTALINAWQAREQLEGQELAPVAQTLSLLLKGESSFQCSQCGFSMQRRHWQCPTCHAWESATPTISPNANDRAA